MMNSQFSSNRRQIIQGIGLTLLPTSLVYAVSDYPQKPIEVVVPAAAGGGTDVVARAYGEAVRKHFPQPVVVSNKPGASGVVGMTDVLNAKPD